MPCLQNISFINKISVLLFSIAVFAPFYSSFVRFISCSISFSCCFLFYHSSSKFIWFFLWWFFFRSSVHVCPVLALFLFYLYKFIPGFFCCCCSRSHVCVCVCFFSCRIVHVALSLYNRFVIICDLVLVWCRRACRTYNWNVLARPWFGYVDRFVDKWNVNRIWYQFTSLVFGKQVFPFIVFNSNNSYIFIFFSAHPNKHNTHYL